MKRGTYLVISTLLVLFLLVGCGPGPVTENPGTVEGDYRDGPYTALSNANERGYVFAEVVIQGGAIATVSLKEFNDKGLEKPADYPYENFRTAMQELPGRFVAANSADIDVVTGASSTSNKAMDAVERALKRSQGFTGTFEGTYMGISAIGERGYGLALVKVDARGNITEVLLKEMAGDKFKDDAYTYEPWQGAVKELPQKFVAANSAEVDAFTGASGSTGLWKQAVADALQKAR